MAVPVALRTDYDGPALRSLARQSKDGPQTRRLLALAMIYDGGTRSEAARIGGVGLQTVRDWVLRFNARGARGPQAARQALNPERGTSPAARGDA
jgi:hypothetical protein